MAFWLAAFLLAGRAPSRAQEESGAGLSRQMKMGIYFYEKGDDTQAMDRFMEVLTQGDPSERALANDYLNRINHRMNTGERLPPAPEAETREIPASAPRRAEPAAEPAMPAAASSTPPVAAAVPSAVPVAAAVPPPTAPEAAPQPAPRYRPPAPAPEADRSVMKKEIKAKMRRFEETALQSLKGHEGVKILAYDNGDPQAIGLPAELLFGPGISFHRDAGKILDALKRLVFSLGGAQAAILPEGTALGDAKILDMRRTMGVASQLFSAGIAPPRIRVNLLNSQVDLPKPMADFKGIVVLFLYDQPLNLVVDNPIGDEGGPPLSMGVYPETIRPDRAEGSVIEFSVQEPPAGLVSWKFQLLQPSSADGRDLAPLQDVVGGSPVFHQIYWNGRQPYFGPALPSGRYECVLTATDGKNRQRALHRWIQVLGAPAPKAAAAPPPAAQAPSLELPGTAAPKPSALIKGKRAATPKAGQARPKASPKKVSRKAKPKKEAKAAGKKKAAAAAAKPAASSSAQPPGSFALDFNPGTYQLTADGEKALAQARDTIEYYPMESLKIKGYADSSEPDPAALAEQRAKMVANLLINRYHVDPKRINVESAAAQPPAHRVEIAFVGGG